MTPAARVAAAVGVLDDILAGRPAERALTDWARGARYAGSGDRVAVRDHVYNALRRRASLAALGGALSGRGLMLGAVREAGDDPDALFGGVGHAPAPLSDAERTHLDARVTLSEAEALDCPDWLVARLREALGPEVAAVLAAMRHRAPVFLRVNTTRCDRAAAIAALAQDSVTAITSEIADTALKVVAGARRVARSRAFTDGLVELQDAASQAVVARLTVPPGGRVLDLCAGGGGKTLALAARLETAVLAHDANPSRMVDLPKRAARAGARIAIVQEPEAAAPFDLVLADVPCSGSGSWRRDPEGKWRLTPDHLEMLRGMQASILDRAAGLVGPGGRLAYATCSLLDEENTDQIARFLCRHPRWRLELSDSWTPLQGCDGFFLAVLTQG